nr:hypothetical protein Iba_scaffold8000.4CG1500 [Ipomoea batatas]
MWASFFFALSVSFSSVPLPLHIMLKLLQLNKYLVTRCNLFAELNIYTSITCFKLDSSFSLG